MVSPELLRRYPFFAGLSHDYLSKLAKMSEELAVEEGHYFFHEEDELDTFYLTLEGDGIGVESSMIPVPTPTYPYLWRFHWKAACRRVALSVASFPRAVIHLP